MTLNVWQRNIVTEAGDVISGAEVEIFHAGESTKPLIYSDLSGTPLLNPFDSAIDGFAQFYAIDGFYDIAVNGVVLWENVPLGTGVYDTPAQAALASLPVGAKYSTKGALTVGDGGHGDFVVKADDGETVDDFGVIEHVNGTIGILQPINGRVNLLQFGATADGSTDDAPALDRASNFGDCIIDGLNKAYAILTKINFPSNTVLENMIFSSQFYEGGTTNKEYLLNAEGSWGAQLPLTANALADSGPNPYIELSAPNAATISRGDMIFISHNVFWNSDNNCYIGEIVEVRQVVGTLVYLQNPLLYSYNTADSASIRKITPVENITLRNVHATGPANPAGILTDDPAQAGGWYDGSYVQGRWAGFFGSYFARNIRIEKCSAQLFNRAGFEFRMSLRNWLTESHVHDIPNYYGCLVADASRNTWIDRCEFTNTRHGVSTGSSNSYGGGIVSHLYIDKVTTTARDAGLDCHDETDFVTMTNCKIFCDGIEGNADGITCQARTFTATDNQITGNINIGIKYQPLSTYAGLAPSCTIHDNIITKQSTKAGTTSGIQVQYGILGSLTGEATSVNGNKIKGAFTRGVSVSVEAAGVDPLRSFSASGNTLNGFTAAGVYIQAAGQDISGGTIEGNRIIASGSFAYDGVVLRADAGRLISGTYVEKNNMANVLNGLRFLSTGTWSDIYARSNLTPGATNPLPAALTTRTIAAGAITLAGDCNSVLRVDTEAAAASDDLDTINGGFEGQSLTLIASSSAQDVVVKDGAGIKLSSDFTLTHADDTITLKKFGSIWLETSRSDNSV